MRIKTFCIIALGLVGSVCVAQAKDQIPDIAVKNGETVEVVPIYYVSKCRSITTATPEVEVLEGPPGLTLAVKDEMVMPKRGNCKTKVKGGIVTATAKDIKAKTEGKLSFRIKYKTSEGDRQSAHTIGVSLYP